jgi:CUT domain
VSSVNNLNNNNKYNNSFHDILTPIQQLKNISNKLNNSNSHNNKLNQTETRPASTPSSVLPPPLQNVEQFSSMLGEEIVNNWRHTSFIDLPPPSPISASAPNAPSTLSKLTTSMHNRMINHFPNFTDCLAQSQNHHLQSGQDVDKNSHHDRSSTASTPVLQDGRSDDNLTSCGRGVTTPMSLPPISKSPSEDNHPLMHNGSGPFNPLQFNPFGERGNNHFKFAEDLNLPPGAMIGRLGDSLIPKGDPMEARLQEMLRYNMDKYANQNLDTLHISRRVRELLSVHNIGQRLFAKYVLGLSQGTVSELLSKPKPWDKLTEKGRDSYRKMHAWACDDQAVLLLKSLIPKKGESIDFLHFLPLCKVRLANINFSLTRQSNSNPLSAPACQSCQDVLRLRSNVETSMFPPLLTWHFTHDGNPAQSPPWREASTCAFNNIKSN